MTSTGAPRSGFVSIGEARLWYEVKGDGPAVLLIHAGIADSRMWDGTFESLADSYRVIRYDMRGFGQTTPGPEQFTDWMDAATLVTDLGIESAFVIGVSMGAKVAAELALMRPEMVRGLILVSPGIFDEAPRSDELLAGWKRIEDALDQNDVDRAIDIETSIWVDGPSRNPETVNAEVRRRVREMNARAWELEPQTAGRQAVSPPVHTRPGDLRVPTLVVAGREDQSDIQRIASRLANDIAGARLVTVEDAAHMLSMEHPEQFVELVRSFLGRLNRR